MGIDIRAAVVLGYRLGDLDEDTTEILDELEQNHDLQRVAPFYDGTSDGRALVGVVLASTDRYQSAPLSLDPLEAAAVAAKLESIFGKRPALYLTPDVS